MSLRKSLITKIILTITIICLCYLSSCKDESFSSDPNYRLSFSVDTLSFDTVFTTIGSSTKRIMIHNKNKKALRINNLMLAEGASSVFKINVDGAAKPDNRFHNLEISAKDSLYVFVSVKIDELKQNTALHIEDFLITETNGNTQKVVLEAYGQNVEILRGKTILNDTILTAEKPYIIYDSLSIIAEKTLELAPGCRLYFHNNADMYVYGNLKATGTFENPIVLRGDRFDNINFVNPIPYNDVAGQWGGLYLLGTGTHKMEYVHTNSGEVGIFIDAKDETAIFDSNKIPKLDVINCKIHNFLFYGIVAQNADITVINSEISNTGKNSVYLNGGTHTFVHTTVANYFNSGRSASQSKNRDYDAPAVQIMNINKSAPMKTTFLNCVISGSIENEFSLSSRFPDKYNGIFKNTYIKRNVLEYPQFAEENNIRWYEKNDTVFKSTSLDYDKQQYYNFEPDSVSPLRGLADPQITFFGEYAIFLDKDLNGNNRGGQPASGAYEWMPTIKED